MAQQYLVHLPDGTQYGPVDRATLDGWRAEGRLPADTLVWPEGAPEWVRLEALATAAPAPAPARVPVAATAPAAAPAEAAVATSAAAKAVAAPTATGGAPTAAAVAQPAKREPVPVQVALGPDAGPDTQPSLPRPSLPRPARPAAPPPAPALRRLLLPALGVLIVVGLLAALWALLKPSLDKRRRIAAVSAHAMAERRVEDRAVGLLAELPPGWLALGPENPLVPAPSARLRLAQPEVEALAAVSVETEPRRMDDLDGYLDDLLQDRLPRQPSMKPGERSGVQLGRGQGRLVRTSWEEGLVPMQGATVAWADGYQLFSLEAWAPVSAGGEFEAQLEALCRGLSATGLVAGRVAEAVERVALEVPELSEDALRLLVSERLSAGKPLDDVPQAALRGVGRGMDALGRQEAAEMRAIYQQVWSPVSESERARLAAVMGEVRAGRAVRPEELQALREVMKAGVLALAPGERARLQALSGRALRQSLLLP